MLLESMYMIDAAIAIDKAKRSRNTSWENINKLFRECTHDRRYKVWFCACTDNMSGFWRVGSHEFLLEFINGKAYVRHVNDCNKYKKMPCYEISHLENGEYRIEWQESVLI